MDRRKHIKVNVKRRLSEAKMCVSDTTGNCDKKKKKSQFDSYRGYWLSHPYMDSSESNPLLSPPTANPYSFPNVSNFC